METWQQNYVLRNLPDLISKTTVNDAFLSNLTNNIFGEADFCSFNAARNSRGQQSECLELYKLACTRSLAYERLINALLMTTQTGALTILINGFLENQSGNVFSHCNIIVGPNSPALSLIVNHFQSALLQCSVIFQRKVVLLGEVLKPLSSKHPNAVKDLINALLNDTFLVELINNKRPLLVKNSVPTKPLKYYISRHLKARHLINPKAFQEPREDIFIIKNITFNELIQVVHNEPVDISDNQTSRLTSRFIVLENEKDYGSICKISEGKPVHLLQHNSGEFTWMRTHGDILPWLQSYASEGIPGENEDVFLKSCLETKNPACISDTPGMGKTALLTSLANKIMEQKPCRLVRFIVLREFLAKVNTLSINFDEHLMDLIAEEASTKHFGKQVVKCLLKSDNQEIELIFDGFDEILSNQGNLCKKVLAKIKKWKSVKLYVATRPHMRGELEQILGVLAYNIFEFREKEQIDFLINFWGHQRCNLDTLKLQEFANQRLKNLKTRMNNFERDIAGIPLQCLLLAEVYQRDAFNYCKRKIGTSGYQPEVVANISSIFDMYKKHIEMRFCNECMNLSSTKYKKLVHAHMHAALELLFPEHVDTFKTKLVGYCDWQVTDLCRFGILERNEIDNATPRFVHRTFAEYFLGQFVSEMLTMHFGFWESKIRISFLDFLINFILPTIQHPERLLTTCNVGTIEDLESSRFRYPVICYFVNEHLNACNIKTKRKRPWTMDSLKLSKTVTACITHDFYHLYSQISEPEIHRTILKERACLLYPLLFLSAKHCCTDVLRLVHQHLKRYLVQTFRSKSPDFDIIPLHIAVERGHFDNTEFLLKQYSNLQRIKYVIHCCVAESIHDSETKIKQKIKILKLLSTKNKDWLNETLPDGTVPLLQSNVHVDLLKCLVEHGASVNAVCKKQGCVLHKLVENDIVSNDYHRMVELLLKNGFTKFNSTDSKRRTPLHVAVLKVELKEETINLFKQHGANFNATDENGDNILFYAVYGVRSEAVLKKLESTDICLQHTNVNHENILHICAKYDHRLGMEYYLQHPNITLNELLAENKKGNTPLIQGLALGEGLTVSIIQKMEQKGLNLKKHLASTGLAALLCNTRITDNMTFEVDTEFIKTIDYLIENEGSLVCRNGKDPWETTLRMMSEIELTTQVNDLLLLELENRDIYFDEKESILGRPDALFSRLKADIPNSFEKTCISLVASRQLTAFKLLKQCLQSGMLKFAMFRSPPPGIIDFTQSHKLSPSNNVAILQSFDSQLSLQRLVDKVDPDLAVLTEQDLKTSLVNSGLAVFICETPEVDIIRRLKSLKQKSVCICSNPVVKSENLNVLKDEFSWNDLDHDFQNDLISLRSLSGLIKYSCTDLPSLKNELLVEFIHDHKIEFLWGDSTAERETDFLFGAMFKFFLCEKLVFMGISEEELAKHAQFGHTIGNFNDNLDRLDYVVIENEEQFKEICRKSSNSVHLIQHEAGHFKLIRSAAKCKQCVIAQKSVDKNLKASNLSIKSARASLIVSPRKCANSVTLQKTKFTRSLSNRLLANCNFKTRFIVPKENFPNQKECEHFPICTCSKHFFDSDNVFKTLFSFPKSNVTAWINILHTNLATITSNENFGGFSQILQTLEIAKSGACVFECWRKLNSITSDIQYTKQVVTPKCIKTFLKCSPSEYSKLQGVAVNTFFPYLLSQKNFHGLEKYIMAGLIKKSKESFKFAHNNLAWYLIAEIVMSNESQHRFSANEVKDAVFRFNHFKPHIAQPTPNKQFFRTIHSNKLRKDSAKFFRFLELFISTDENSNVTDNIVLNLKTEPQFLPKIVRSCAFHNFYKLFKTFMSLSPTEISELEDLIILAVKYAEIPLIDFVIGQYVRQTNKAVTSVKVALKSSSSLACIITVLHIAALRGNFNVIKHLLTNHGFEKILHDPMLHDILHYCVVNTQNCPNDIVERKQIINLILQTDTVALNHKNQLQQNALLVSNVHVDLLIHLIDHDIDLQTASKVSQNILHLCSRYMTALQYDKLVSKVIDHPEMFLLEDKSNNSPLHYAVQYLELLPSTLEAFVKVKATSNIRKTTVLITAVNEHRSAELIQLLINAGADINCKGENNKTLLHYAAEKGNLTALRYFLMQGLDANATDTHSDTPLHRVLRLHKSCPTNIHEAVKALVQHKADVNATGKNGDTPMSIAIKANKKRIANQTISYLKNAGTKKPN